MTQGFVCLYECGRARFSVRDAPDAPHRPVSFILRVRDQIRVMGLTAVVDDVGRLAGHRAIFGDYA